jgi:hypothetical protein
MVQVVSLRPLTAKARVRSRVGPCWFCGGQSDTVTGFSSSTLVFPCQFHSTSAPLLGRVKNNWSSFSSHLHVMHHLHRLWYLAKFIYTFHLVFKNYVLKYLKRISFWSKHVVFKRIIKGCVWRKKKIPGRSILDLWWTKWHWDRFFPEYFGFPLSISFHRCSIKMEKQKETSSSSSQGCTKSLQGCGCVRSICCGALQ